MSPQREGTPAGAQTTMRMRGPREVPRLCLGGPRPEPRGAHRICKSPLRDNTWCFLPRLGLNAIVRDCNGILKVNPSLPDLRL